jgi:putative transposase
LTVRDIRAQLAEIYGVEVSAGLISEVLDSVLAEVLDSVLAEVLDEVKAWQGRPLENLDPVLFLDALMVKLGHEGRAGDRAVYAAIGMNEEGQKEAPGAVDVIARRGEVLAGSAEGAEKPGCS